MGKTVEECYEVLGLKYGATEDEIRSAYRKNALKCHPDKNPDDPLSTQKFQELGHAYRRLTGEEDSDSDDEYDDDDMEIWRDFFFFLFRDEIMSRVRCKCEKCGSAGEHEEDDFLASLAKAIIEQDPVRGMRIIEQEEQQQFTEEEMAQFTSFTNLKEQREANKRKFCGRNQSNSKPEQKETKERKPKLKSNKQLKLEQWKREKEVSEIATQINQTNPKRQGKKAFSKDVKTKDLHQQKSSVQPGVVDQEKTVKQPTDCGSNKRNTRKKKNRNKSRQQNDKETDSSQIDSHKKTTLTEQKVASSIQDAVRNVTVIKPETTRRQDDVTGRLPRYTRYTSPRMMQGHSRVRDSTLGSQKNTSQKQNGRGWFENQMQPPRFATEAAASRPTYGANIWQKRQEKQQFLAELQPSNQNDEDLQLQIALEMSKKQAEIDAQQREISMLEKEMEETLQIEKQFQLTTGEEETRGTPATVMGPDSFPPLGIPLRCELARSDVDEEWLIASDSEDEWQESSGDSNGDDYTFQADETSEQLQTNEHRDLDEEQHLSEGSASSGKDNMNAPTSDMQLPQHSRDLQASEDSCPYGKNCCLGKCCMYSHPPSIDNRKSQRSNSSSSQDLCDRSESDDRCHPACNLTEKRTSSVTSFEELPGAADHSQPLNSTRPSDNASISHFDESMTNQSLHSLQPEASVIQIRDSVDSCTTQESTSAGDSVTFGSLTSVGATGLSEGENQCNLASGKLENFDQSSRNDVANQESQASLGDRSSSSEEKPKRNNNTNELQINTNGHLKTLIGDQGKDGSTVLGGTSAAEDTWTVGSHAPVPNVYVIANAQFPFGLPAGSALKQSAAALTPLANLSAGATLQNYPQKSQHSSSFPVNYARQMPAALAANVIPQTLTTSPAVAIPQTLPATSQNSRRPASGDSMQTSAATQQSDTVVSSTGTTNSFPAVPGFPFLPFGNIFPFLNPANAASLMAAAAASGMPFPITPGPSNSVQNQQGGFTMNQTMMPPYLKTGLGGGVSPLSQYLPMQDQLNGLPGMTVEGNVPVPHPSQHVSVPCPSQHVSVSHPQHHMMAPRPSQPSQAGVTNDPRSPAPTVPQQFRFPYPFVNPQAFANVNTGMAMGMPYSMLQNQTSVQSGMTPSQERQGNDKPTEQYRVEHTGPTGVTKPTDVKRDIGQERRSSIGRGSRIHSLRRPATVPKVIQHQQASK